MINIQDIIPFMEKGWVACDKSGHWTWFADKPEMYRDYWWETETYFIDLYVCFDIAPADDWTKSLIKVGGNGAKS